jgi:phosphoglycerate dehydrogenase-like enzyme
MPPPPPPLPPAAPANAATPTTPTETPPRWIVQWCLDGWHDAREALARLLPTAEFYVRPLDPNGPSLADQCKGAHVLVPTTALVDAGCIAAALPAPLQLIAQPASAVGNIDLSAAKAAGVPVTHAPGHNAAATAEVALLLMLTLLRRAAEAPASLARQDVGRPVGKEAGGRTVGVVGITGRVGRRFARACAALGMRVIGVDSWGRLIESAEAEKAEAAQAAAAAAEEQQQDGEEVKKAAFKRGLLRMLEQSDVVSVHVPYIPGETDALFGRDEFLVMARRGAYFINTARAAVVDRAALEEALGGNDEGGGRGGGGKEEEAEEEAEQGRGGGGGGGPPPPRLAGAGLDVMWTEPCDPRDPLLRHPRAVVLPHLGCASEEAYAALAGVLARNIQAAREGRWRDLEHRVV